MRGLIQRVIDAQAHRGGNVQAVEVRWGDPTDLFRFAAVFTRRGRIQHHPELFEKLYLKMMESGLKPGTAHQVHGVRFVIALALGTRQGESLALKWDCLDERRKTLRIKRALQRQTWQHGCDDPHQCGQKYHKTKPCPPTCKRHTRACPPPCSADCTDHARWCPQRKFNRTAGRWTPPGPRRVEITAC